MKIIVKDGLIYHNAGKDPFVRENVIGCQTADRIARANGLIYAEDFVKHYDKKEMVLDSNTFKILEKKIL